MPDDAPNQVKPYLDEIADRLWSNNAAVMVGAGFSRNAKSVGSTSAYFPNWQGTWGYLLQEAARAVSR